MTDFPRIEYTVGGAALITTGRAVDPATGEPRFLSGYYTRDPHGELKRLRELDKPAPSFAHREWPIHGPCTCRVCEQ